MIEILKIVLPALLVLVTAYLLIDRLLRNDHKRREHELRKANGTTITPVRLRAYERLMLVLERTSPSQIILQTIKPGMTNLELQQQLLHNVREEFGHNLSQQIYVSNELWTAIVSARESLIQLVNICSSQLQAGNNASELAERIIQLFAQSEETPTEIAKNLLKQEIRTFF